jgi:hypothetical protein
MKIIKTKVYEFDELSDKAKEKAREWYRDGDDLPFLEEYMREKAQDILAEWGIKEAEAVKPFYSLSYCQGDGAMIEFSGMWGEWHVKVKPSGNYYHYNSKEFDIWRDINDGADIENADEKTCEEFNEEYVRACHKLEGAGYAEIEYQRSGEVVDENIRANEYTFTETGKRFG